MNILGFAAAAYDKFAAKKKLWRISEKKLRNSGFITRRNRCFFGLSDFQTQDETL